MRSPMRTLVAAFAFSFAFTGHVMAQPSETGKQTCPCESGLQVNCDQALFEPSASDPRIVAAIAAQTALFRAMATGDAHLMERLFAPNVLVNAPINRVADRADVFARLNAGQISYEANAIRNIEYAGVRGDSVVIMGEEIVEPNRDTPHNGQTIHRRFTDVWKETAEGFQLTLRQATIISAE